MNKYEILGVSGEGAYGVVLKCRNKETDDVGSFDTDEDEIIRKNTQREVRMLRMLRHHNIVDIKEAFKRKGRVYLVFEYMEKNLLEVLEESPDGLDPEYIRQIVYQIVKSVHHCHSFDVIHRDVKPENLLINKKHELKLCDFGFARILPKPNDPPITDYVATRWYRSTELLLSDPNYGKPVDMWAIACIMGELIDGEPLFPGDNEIDQLYLIQKVLGPLPPSQQALFRKNQRFQGLDFPQLDKPETIERRYLGKISKKGLTFLKALLKLDPTERLTAEQALDHPYFDGLREMFPTPVQSALQNTPNNRMLEFNLKSQNTTQTIGIKGSLKKNIQLNNNLQQDQFLIVNYKNENALNQINKVVQQNTVYNQYKNIANSSNSNFKIEYNIKKIKQGANLGGGFINSKNQYISDNKKQEYGQINRGGGDNNDSKIYNKALSVEPQIQQQILNKNQSTQKINATIYQSFQSQQKNKSVIDLQKSYGLLKNNNGNIINSLAINNNKLGSLDLRAQQATHLPQLKSNQKLFNPTFQTQANYSKNKFQTPEQNQQKINNINLVYNFNTININGGLVQNNIGIKKKNY